MKDLLGDRMKEYESAFKVTLSKRQPLCLRLDGVHFHTLTKQFKKPLDLDFMKAMNSAGLLLCKEAQGAKLAYVQSDEISILLIDYQRLNSAPWFGKKVQKLTSVAASIASVGFNSEMEKQGRTDRGYFDCRVIPLAREEVANYFIWRQNDCVRNSILGLGQHILGKKSIHGMNQRDIVLALEEEGIDWGKCPSWQRYGRAIYRTTVVKKIMEKASSAVVTMENRIESLRTDWEVMLETPIFKEDGRELINNLVWPKDEEGSYPK